MGSWGFAAVSSLIASTILQPAQAAIEGSVGFSSSSFMYSAKGRGTSATSFDAKFDGDYHSKLLTGKVNAQFYSFVNSKPAIGGEAPELYLATQDGLLDGHQVSLGRRIYEWSKVDNTWRSQMSLWSPRYTWDLIYPEQIGMTGLHYTYQTRHFKFLAFGSPISVPERGTPTVEEDKNITSQNPLWNPLPQTLNIQGSPTAVEYSLVMPSLQKILLRPNFALKGRYDFDEGYWFSVNTGVLPVHAVQMAAEPYVDSSNPSGTLGVNIIPQLPMRNINTLEFGYESPDNQWNVWASASYEQPFHFENQKNWLNPIITPSSIFSIGTNFQVTSNFRFDGGILFIHEQPFNTSSSLAGVDVQLPTRFPLKQGIKAGGNWRFSDYTESNVAWIQDLIYSSHFVSFDVQHKIRGLGLMIGGGADLMFASTNKGWVGQFYGDDRLRGWLRYAF